MNNIFGIEGEYDFLILIPPLLLDSDFLTS